MDTIEKVYCTGHDNNDALVAANHAQGNSNTAQ
jgi:hypothetical protein